MSYAVKYASAFYGPFRDAADSAPLLETEKAIRWITKTWRGMKEALTDIEEGADIIMVKPGNVLIWIQKYQKQLYVPIAAYSVSGEYAMVKAAAANGLDR